MYFYINIKSIRGEDMTHALEKIPLGLLFLKEALKHQRDTAKQTAGAPPMPIK